MRKITEKFEEKEIAADAVCEKIVDEPSEEERLALYEKRLQSDLEKELSRIEYEKKRNEIRKRFEAEHAEEYAKIKKFKSEVFLEEKVYSKNVDNLKTKKWLDDAQLSELKAKYKALETRQIEILDICTSKEEIQNCWSDGQLDALINEYLASEKLKLIIIDRIKSNICKHDLSLGVHSFGGNHVEIHRDVEYDPNNRCCRDR